MFEQLVDCQGLSDDHVGLDIHTERLQGFDLTRDDGFRQTELGNTVYEHSAGGVQGFEYRHGIPFLGQVARTGQSAWT